MQKWPRSRGSLSLKLWQLLTIHRSECEWALQESGKERWAGRTGKETMTKETLAHRPHRLRANWIPEAQSSTPNSSLKLWIWIGVGVVVVDMSLCVGPFPSPYTFYLSFLPPLKLVCQPACLPSVRPSIHIKSCQSTKWRASCLAQLSSVQCWRWSRVVELDDGTERATTFDSLPLQLFFYYRNQPVILPSLRTLLFSLSITVDFSMEYNSAKLTKNNEKIRKWTWKIIKVQNLSPTQFKLC